MCGCRPIEAAAKNAGYVDYCSAATRAQATEALTPIQPLSSPRPVGCATHDLPSSNVCRLQCSADLCCRAATSLRASTRAAVRVPATHQQQDSMSRPIRVATRLVPFPEKEDAVPAHHQKVHQTMAILYVLVTTGWAANHFTALLPTLAEAEHLPTSTVQAAFGVYALGMLPGLLGGGALSDRVSRPHILIAGVLMAGTANATMSVLHHDIGLYAGRLTVGLGVGIAVSSGTAWMGDLRGSRGVVQAGAALTTGFTLGPVASALIVQFSAHHAATAAFAASSALSGLAVVSAVYANRLGAADRTAEPNHTAPALAPARHGPHALLVAGPMALWVFSSTAVAMVTLTERMTDEYHGPLLIGLSAILSLSSGLLAQIAARRLNSGPYTGCLGASLAAVGLTLIAIAGTHLASRFRRRSNSSRLRVRAVPT